MLRQLHTLSRFTISLTLAVALVLSLPAFALQDEPFEGSDDGALITRSTLVSDEENEDEDLDDFDAETPPYTGQSETVSESIDTPTPTDNDGTDSDGIDTPTPTDNDVVYLDYDTQGSQLLTRLGSPIPVKVVFQEKTTDFTVDDVQVTNGDANNFQGSKDGTVYTLDVTPNAVGNVTMGVTVDPAEGANESGETAMVQMSLGIPYDDNKNGSIEKDEAINAVIDYFNGLISKDDAIDIIVLYFSGA